MHQHTGIDSDQRCDLTLLGDVTKLNRRNRMRGESQSTSDH